MNGKINYNAAKHSYKILHEISKICQAIATYSDYEKNYYFEWWISSEILPVVRMTSTPVIFSLKHHSPTFSFFYVMDKRTRINLLSVFLHRLQC